MKPLKGFSKKPFALLSILTTNQKQQKKRKLRKSYRTKNNEAFLFHSEISCAIKEVSKRSQFSMWKAFKTELHNAILEQAKGTQFILRDEWLE